MLLVRKGARWRNPFPGDDRVDERVTGFENVPAALAAAAALQAGRWPSATRSTRASTRSSTGIRARPRARSPTPRWSATRWTRLPHVVTFSCLYVDGEALVTELDRRGFAVASGSACTASTLEPSHVLAAMGALTHGNVRVSLGRDTTAEDVDGFAAALPAVVEAILRGRRLATPPMTPTSSSTAAGCAARCRSSSSATASATVEVGRRVAVAADDPAARVDVPAWCRMRGQEYVGEDAADDGVPRYVVRRTQS